MNFFKPILDEILDDKPMKFGWISSVLFLDVILFFLIYIFIWLGSTTSAPTEGHALVSPIILAVVTYVAKTAISGAIVLRNRRHLLKALHSYIETTVRDLSEHHEFDDKGDLNMTDIFNELEEKINKDQKYTPYPTFDAKQGLTIQDIKNDYRYLHTSAVGSVVDFLNKEAYALSVMNNMSDPLVINMEQSRKIGMVKEMLDSKVLWYSSAKKAYDEISYLKDLMPLDWAMNFLVAPKVLSILFRRLLS